ncbi:MAG: hypothetical protein J2P36_26945, partial [Ktedonobacteraceae bacterium]|nr:hypothetical protein [Ktedonobacteraceae bacterium]
CSSPLDTNHKKRTGQFLAVITMPTTLRCMIGEWTQSGWEPQCLYSYHTGTVHGECAGMTETMLHRRISCYAPNACSNAVN